jgi:predicted ATPase
VSGTDEQSSLDALDELLSARLIVEVRNETRPYNISHDRIREVVYERISEARREVFHRRALTALTNDKAPSAELAHHALSAKEWGFAFQHSLNAGDEAMRLYEVTTAVGHYETARTLLSESKAEVDTEPASISTCNLARPRIGISSPRSTDHLRGNANAGFRT